MNKSIKYAMYGAALGGAVNALFNAAKQLGNLEETGTFDWEENLMAFLKGGAIGGVGGFAIGVIRDNEMGHILMEFGGAAGVIANALDNYNPDNTSRLAKKAKRVQEKLNREFGNMLSEYPSINGSLIKGTAIQGSDIDIHLKFNNNAGSVYEIRSIVEDYLNERFEDRHLVGVRSQNHSVGLLFSINGEEYHIDIVPMRSVDNAKGDYYIYSKNNDGVRKTNARVQNNTLKFTESQKKIIRLLKGWREDNDLRIPSIMIEYIVKRAFKENVVPRKLDKALLFMIRYLVENIVTIRIVDPANTNNIISDKLSYNEKVNVQDFCFKMLDSIKNDERNILDYFQVEYY